jgi:SAM-dependent methyltransferase
MRILHVFSRATLDPAQRFLGTTKDQRGRAQYCAERGIERRELAYETRGDAALGRELGSLDLGGFDAVFIEGTYFPAAIRRLKKRWPGLRVLARGVNAEFLHWLDSARAGRRAGSWKRILFDLKSALCFGLADLRCARGADWVLAITRWEEDRYWSSLCPRARVATLPYFLPDEYRRDIPAGVPKADRCVSLMTTRADRPFHRDAAANLIRLVNGLGAAEPGWSFAIAGDFPRAGLPACPRLEVLGVVENPLAVLAGARAMALLSDYGFGFKTKLLEAIACGCFLLVTPGVHARLPEAVRRYARVVDPRSVDSFRAALASCREPLPAGDPNRELREEAYAVLDRALGVEPPRGPPAVDLQEAAIRRLIARIGGAGYRDGSSTRAGWAYHPIPFPEFADVPVHKDACLEELRVIRADLGSETGLRVLDLGCALGYFTFEMARNAREVVAVEADPEVSAVVEALRAWKQIDNVRVVGGSISRPLLAQIPGDFDVALMLNVHMWIEKQLGRDETILLLRDLAARTGRLYFQTAHAESGGKRRVEDLRVREDIQAYLEGCGFARVRHLRDTRAHEGTRCLFACER